MRSFRVIAYSSLVNEDITTHLAAQALKGHYSFRPSRSITIHDIQQTVGDYFGVKIEDFKARKRTKADRLP